MSVFIVNDNGFNDLKEEEGQIFLSAETVMLGAARAAAAAAVLSCIRRNFDRISSSFK